MIRKINTGKEVGASPFHFEDLQHKTYIISKSPPIYDYSFSVIFSIFIYQIKFKQVFVTFNREKPLNTEYYVLLSKS